jgi:hypothetical protein
MWHLRRAWKTKRIGSLEIAIVEESVIISTPLAPGDGTRCRVLPISGNGLDESAKGTKLRGG